MRCRCRRGGRRQHGRAGRGGRRSCDGWHLSQTWHGMTAARTFSAASFPSIASGALGLVTPPATASGVDRSLSTLRGMAAPSRSPLRGREQELAVVRRCLSRVQAGTACVVVVEGSAGLGKTRLLDECVSMAGELSFRVGRGAAEPGRVIELGALFDALFEGNPPLADRRAVNDVHASSEFLFWLLQDVQSLIEEAALKSPLLICLDDLHWGGVSLSLAMRQLPLRLSSLPVAWVMAFRPEQGLHQVQQAKIELIESGAELIRSGRLDRDAVAQVARDVLG